MLETPACTQEPLRRRVSFRKHLRRVIYQLFPVCSLLSQALFGAVLLVWKVQHPSYSYAYLVAVFTMPIIWVPGLR